MKLFGKKQAEKTEASKIADHDDLLGDSSVDSIVVSQSHATPVASDESTYTKVGDFDPESIDQGMGIDHAAHDISEERKKQIIKEIGKAPRPLPLIGHLPIKTQYALSLGALVASLALVGGFAGYGFVASANNQTRAATGTRLEMLTQRILASAQYAVRGEKTGADRLVESRSEANDQLTNLQEGRGGVAQMDLGDNANLSNATNVMRNDIFPVVDKLIALAPSLSSLQKNNEDLEKAMATIFTNSEQLISIFQANGSSPIYGTAAEHIRVLAERIRRNGSNLLTSSDIRIEPLSEYVADVQNLRKTVENLTKGDPTIGLAPVTDPQSNAILKSLSENSVNLFSVAKFIEENAPGIVTARRSLTSLVSSTESGLQSAGAFRHDMQVKADNAFRMVYVSVLFVLGTLGALVLLGLVNSRAAGIESWNGAFKNKKNEKDIIDFMEAIDPLEDNDLTARFNRDKQAMEGITGAIRSSVTEAVSSLHDAIYTVQDTAIKVTDGVEKSVLSSQNLNEFNERQASEIDGVVSRVDTLTEEITSVTRKTIAAADVTTNARQATTDGTKLVTETNEKMAQIRANMQDVLKSAKHQGETSHEIGLIVEVIENITDLTQVLAVNASLEASKAGNTGSGFKVIATEVSRLSEQSNEALKTITALVQRIQTEAGTTIKTVEESTNNVVEGADLASRAAAKLGEIDALSTHLFELMNEIRTQTETQTANASEVTGAMQRLTELSGELQKSVREVVSEVGGVNQSMDLLKKSVKKFKTDPDMVDA